MLNVHFHTIFVSNVINNVLNVQVETQEKHLCVSRPIQFSVFTIFSFSLGQN